MKKRFRTWAVIFVVAMIAVVAVVIVFARGPLRQAGGRTCLGCFETHWRGSSTIRATEISGDYELTRDSEYLIRFDAGTVLFGGRELEPGCYLGAVEDGTQLRFDDARGVRVRVPPEQETCAEEGSTAPAP